MKTTCKQSLAMLALAFVLGTMFLPSTAFSSAAAGGSRGSLADSPSQGVMPLSKVDISGPGSGGSLGNSNVMPLRSNVGGKSYAEWSAAWWQWTMSHPFSQFFDPTGQYFAVDQSGPVWFLQGVIDTPERSCTMPSDTYLVCPIFLYINDYPCPDPNWQPPPGQSMEEWLTEGAKAVVDGIAPFPFTLEVDGIAVNQLASYRTTSPMFHFTGDLSMQAFDPCVTGTSQPGVSDGYMVILKPLSPGEHTLHFSGFGDVLVHLTVVEDGDMNSGLPLDAPYGTTAQARANGRGTVTATQAKTWSLIKTLYR